MSRWLKGLACGLVLIGLAAPGWSDATGGWRVVEASTGKGVRWRDLAGRLARADVVFVGEQHDDPETHRVEATLLAELHKRVGDRLTLAMEMLERDGQGALDDYLAGRIDEATFGQRATLWKTYATDYRPLVEFARERRLPVWGSNAPQKIVRSVGRDGLLALSALSPQEKGTVAAFVNAPESDAYFQRFAAVMQGDGGAHGMSLDAPALRRIYQAQCLRDDTMAETIAQALGQGRFVYHVNGSFHSDAGLGTASRVLWRRPLGTRLLVVKVVPVRGDVAGADLSALRAEADYLIVVPDHRPERKKE